MFISLGNSALLARRPVARIQSFGGYAIVVNSLGAPALLTHRPAARIQCYEAYAAGDFSLGCAVLCLMKRIQSLL